MSLKRRHTLRDHARIATRVVLERDVTEVLAWDGYKRGAGREAQASLGRVSRGARLKQARWPHVYTNSRRRGLPACLPATWSWCLCSVPCRQVLRARTLPSRPFKLI